MVNISDYGKIIVDVWNKLPERFQSIELDEFVIMPNHLHGIIKVVGADLCVCPYVEDEQTKKGRTRRFAPTTNGTMVQNHDNQRIYPRHQRTRMVTFNGKLWQRNYYEHVIRDDWELKSIREYIRYNPQKWDEDEENPKTGMASRCML
jgi:REP element-mobilizing transposase RayT